MNDQIIFLSERGQVTIPKKFRAQIQVKRFICHLEGDKIVLEPLQTREEFLNELDQAEKDWEKEGGIGLKEMKKKHNLK